MRIRTQLLFAAALALAVALGVGLMSWRSVQAARQAEAEQERSRTVARHAAALLLLTQEYPRYYEERVAQQWRERHAALTGELTAAGPSATSRRAHEAMQQSASRLPALFDRLVELPAAPDTPLTARRADFLVDQLINETQGLADGVYRWSRDAAVLQQQAARRFLWIMTGSLALVVALLLGQTIVIARRLVAPLARIERAAAAVEAGNFDARVGVESNDELGRLSRGFDQMTATLAERRDELRAEMRRREAIERRLVDITNSIPAIVGHFGLDERITFANTPALRKFGLDPDTVVGLPMATALGDEIYRQHVPHLPAVLAGRRVRFEATSTVGDLPTHYQANLVPDMDADGVVRGFYAMTFDITALKRAEQARAAGELRLRTITDNLPVLISYVDDQHIMRFCNDTYRRWLGVDPHNLIDRPLVEAIGAVHYEARRPHLVRALKGEQVSFEVETDAGGRTRYLKTEYIPDVRADGEVIGVYALSADITALKEAETRMSELARIDALTGLPNRRQLTERFDEALARSRRTGRPLGLMFLDIDHFKSINDSRGHHGGDLVLQEFAARLRASVRVTDTVARLAGDEFVVILEGLNVGAEAEDVARKVIDAMKPPIPLAPGDAIQVTTSIGVVVSAAQAADAAALMSRADDALYKAKRAGRNRFAVSTY